jgi:hypothetical protein
MRAPARAPRAHPGTRSFVRIDHGVTWEPATTGLPDDKVFYALATDPLRPLKNRTMNGLAARKPQSVRFTVVT